MNERDFLAACAHYTASDGGHSQFRSLAALDDAQVVVLTFEMGFLDSRDRLSGRVEVWEVSCRGMIARRSNERPVFKVEDDSDSTDFAFPSEHPLQWGWGDEPRSEIFFHAAPSSPMDVVSDLAFVQDSVTDHWLRFTAETYRHWERQLAGGFGSLGAHHPKIAKPFLEVLNRHGCQAKTLQDLDAPVPARRQPAPRLMTWGRNYILCDTLTFRRMLQPDC